jgi:uncharacterized repeat protein (TIGR01451 family)
MGNGRRSGRISGKSSGRGLPPVLGAMLVLLLAGSVLIRSGSHRYAQNASTSVATSPFATSSRPGQHSKPNARAILGQLPLMFEPNQGQADANVKFLARGAGYSLYLNATDATLAMRTGRAAAGSGEQFVRMKLVGANPGAVTSGTDPLPGKSNYILGNDPQQWHRGVPQFAGVRYASVYPGIDLVFYGNQGRLEYDFRVAPGANPSRAELQFEGASKLELSGGDLVLTGDDQGGVRLQAPQIYQRDGDRHTPVTGRFVLRAGNRVGFEIGSYDHSRELVIDPQLIFSSYFGGSGSETFPSVAVNGNGLIYIVGTTQGSPQAAPAGTAGNTFPNSGTVTLIPSSLSLTTTSPSHIFVAEINPSQPSSVVYETFLGGTGSDSSVGIGVDNAGNAYIVGNTTSLDFPTSGTNVLGYQTTPATKGPQCASVTCTSMFVSVLSGFDPTGATLSYSSYLSGNGNDQASGMTNDLNGDVFITGTTTSNDTPSISDAFPATLLPVPYQVQPNSTIQFFVTKVNTKVPSTGGIAYSTYFGGSTPIPPIAVGGGIVVDSNGNMYFTGTTNFYNSGLGAFGNSNQSSDFPILNAYQPCLDTPPPTILPNPNPCTTPASPYPTDAFVAKMNPLGQAGTQLLYSTYLGGTANDSSTSIAIDTGGANIYFTGSTNSSDFILPTGSAAFQPCLDSPPVTPPLTTCPVIAAPAPTDAYVAKMNNPTLSTTGTPNDVALTYFTYLGGGGNDSGLAIAVDTSADALVTGATSSGIVTGTTNFPVTTAGPIQSQLNGPQNAFFAQINTTTTTGQTAASSYVTYFGGNGTDRGTGITVDPTQNTYFVGDTTSTTLEVEDPLPPGGGLLNGPSDAFVVKLESATNVCINCVPPTVSPTGVVAAGNPVTIVYTVANEGPDPATNITVSGLASSGVTFNSATAGTGTCSAPGNTNQVVCQIPALQSGSSSLVTFQVTPNQVGSYSTTASVSSSNNTNTNNTAPASFTAGGFTMTVNPSSQTVHAGDTAPFTVQLTPSQAFGANVSLSCSSLPTGATCNFTSTSVSFGTNGVGPVSSVLNLTTSPQPTPSGNLRMWHGPIYAFWLMVPGMAVLGLGAGGKGRGKGKTKGRVLGLLMLCLFFALLLLQPACHSTPTIPPVSGTPSGTYSLTVTAGSGTFTQSAQFSLIVTP